MAKYTLTNKAVEDLSSIWEYTYEAWSESQADNYYELLTNSFGKIVQNPELGKHYTEIDPAILGFHVGKHIIFYRLVNSGDIAIVRILHQQMDLKSRMNE
jgi:toxin ParE1/3/4